jgi:hypothetical protein
MCGLHSIKSKIEDFAHVSHSLRNTLMNLNTLSPRNDTLSGGCRGQYLTSCRSSGLLKSTKQIEMGGTLDREG